MPREDDNSSENFEPYEDKKSILEEQKIESNHRDLVVETLDTESHVRNGLSKHTPQGWLPANKSSSFLREVRFSKQKFSAGKPILDIKYCHPGPQDNNLFYPFNAQLEYALANYFAKFETTKRNVDRFLSDALMAPFTEKLSYQNADK